MADQEARQRGGLTRAQAIEERNFLLARLAVRDHDSWKWVGISSNEMVDAAITGRPVHGFNIPHDQADLSRCEETYKRAPEHLKPKLLPILRGFRALLERKKSWPNSYSLEEANAWVAEAITDAGREALDA